jgi:hypothetical protein
MPALKQILIALFCVCSIQAVDISQIDGETRSRLENQLTANSVVYYNNTTTGRRPIIWTGQAVTATGVSTFTPTNSQGQAVFAQIDSVVFAPLFSTSTLTDVPITCLKSISADLKTVQCTSAKGTILGVLGATMIAVPDGTTNYCTIYGR